MAIWESSMLKTPPRTEDIAELVAYLKTTINQAAVMFKDLDYVLNGSLDVKNIRSESLTSKVIQAGAVTAEKIDVEQLSAISADMGEITAGIIRGIEIYGSLISTNETGYPKAEMSITENLFRVSLDVDNTLTIAGNYEGSTAIYFASPSNNFIHSINDTRSYIGSLKELRIESGQDILLEPIVGNVVVANTNKLYFTAQGQTLADMLSNLDSRITALEP